MSDIDVIQSLDALEQFLQGPLMEAEAIASWQKGFDAALASADRGPEWPTIVTRARKLAARLDAAANDLAEQQNLIRKEMHLHRRGTRALKGYKPG